MGILTNLILLALFGEILCGDYFYSNGTKFYFSAPMKKNWYQAHRFCHSNSMHLVTIYSEEENQILLEVIYGKYQPVIKTTDYYWASGTDMGQADLEFYWFESGHAVLYTNWLDGHPVANRKGCILLYAGLNFKWGDDLCESPYYFICQDRLFTPDASKRNMYINSSYVEVAYV